MLVYEKKENCAGCTACMNICPYGAISMEPDDEGFLYPLPNEDLCTDCGLCQKICPFQDEYRINSNFEQPKIYAAKHRDDDVRINSSSGGMFTAISDYILGSDGVIYGAAFDEQFKVCHQKAVNEQERNKIRGSKYVQSDLNGIFSEIKVELKKGRKVLFTGTPCQNAGLHAYLNKSYEHLYLCDIVCHGTPSPLIWKEHIDFMAKRYNKKIIAYNFRSKWRGRNVTIIFDDGSLRYNSSDLLTFSNIFYSCLAHRPSCYHCRFSNFHRPSDITIADFWGIEKSMPDFEDNKGVSLVLVNSSKGKELFEKISQTLYFEESNTIDCLQQNLHSPTKEPAQRYQFWHDYWDKGFEYVLKKYADYGAVSQLKMKSIKKLNELGVKSLLKRVLQR